MHSSRNLIRCLFFFFFNDTATTEIYTLSLHDALPILSSGCRVTSARLVDLRTPMTCLVRLRLPLRCRVFTFVTRTEKMACTASLISVLFALGLTMNV